MTVYIPIKAIILFALIIFAVIILGLISDLIHFINKIREDEHACKEEKNTQNSQNCKKSY